MTAVDVIGWVVMVALAVYLISVEETRRVVA